MAIRRKVAIKAVVLAVGFPMLVVVGFVLGAGTKFVMSDSAFVFEYPSPSDGIDSGPVTPGAQERGETGGNGAAGGTGDSGASSAQSFPR